METLSDLYLNDMKSLPEISEITGIAISSVRNRLIKEGIELRSRGEAIKLVSHKLGHPGVKRNFTDEWKNNMKIAALRRGENNAKGFSLKPGGYYEITRGKDKGRLLHVVIMEIHIGRRIRKNEVVHHINEDKTDNRIENLQLMTRSKHASLHANKLSKNRNRNKKGQFK